MDISEHKIRLVIAEDDFLASDEIKRILRGSQYNIVGEAFNGEEAVEIVSELRPDVILMDIKMPKKDGLEASHEITNLCPTPIVILTAYESTELALQASKAGVSAFLDKPPKLGDIDRAIIIAMTRHKDLMELRRINNELKKALKEIKVLKGILPICANCKKIRDDKGYWKQVESYIEMHSDVSFTHGMCPECSDKFYGDQGWYREIKKKDKQKK